MSEMVERVAKAMEARATRGSAMPPWREIAKAAIAEMREPTDAILDAGPPPPYMDAWVWGKMIEEALK